MIHINAKSITWSGGHGSAGSAVIAGRYLLHVNLVLAGWAWSVKDQLAGGSNHGIACGTKADAKMSALKALRAIVSAA